MSAAEHGLVDSESSGPHCTATDETTMLGEAVCQMPGPYPHCTWLITTPQRTLPAGKTPDFHSEKTQFPSNVYSHCLSFDDLYVGCVRLVGSSFSCLCFSLGMNSAHWPYSSKCTDIFHYLDAVTLFTCLTSKDMPLLCWNKARVFNTCQA